MKTVQLEDAVWAELQKLKLSWKLRSLNDVVKRVLGEKKE